MISVDCRMTQYREHAVLSLHQKSIVRDFLKSLHYNFFITCSIAVIILVFVHSLTLRNHSKYVMQVS